MQLQPLHHEVTQQRGGQNCSYQQTQSHQQARDHGHTTCFKATCCLQTDVPAHDAHQQDIGAGRNLCQGYRLAERRL